MSQAIPESKGLSFPRKRESRVKLHFLDSRLSGNDRGWFSRITAKLKRLPDTPGVYFFLGRSRKILYIGRATSLRNRVRSYFTADIAEKRSQWIERMISEARSVDFKKTDSVLEAMLLEADLIKKFQPLYNTSERDDKSFNCVAITREAFPAVFTERSRDIDFEKSAVKGQGSKVRGQKLLAAYGPYTNGFQLQTAMKIIRRIFPYRDVKCKPLPPSYPSLERREGRPCFNRQIGLCPGTCTGEITKGEYAKTIRNLRLFFEGKKARLLKVLQREMKEAAKAQEFETAGELKRQLFALKHIQDVALLRNEATPPSIPPLKRGEGKGGGFRIEAYDLSHFGGKEIVGAMAVVENGVARQSEYRLFKLRSIKKQHEVAGLSEILRRRFNHPEWPFPQLIAVDGNEVQKQAAETVLAEFKQNIPVVAVVKDERHKPREIVGFREHSNILQNVGMSLQEAERAILLANAEAHRFVLKFQRTRRVAA